VVYVAEASAGDLTPEWGMGVTVAAAEGAAAADDTPGETSKTGNGVNGGGKKGWRGRGEWREEWGEQLVGRKDPAVFVLEVASGQVARLQGLPKDSVAASGPVWAPPSAPGAESTAVVCPVWSGDIDNFKSTSRRLGLVFCFNR
jgi:acylaminoacyl-peptidase